MKIILCGKEPDFLSFEKFAEVKSVGFFGKSMFRDVKVIVVKCWQLEKEEIEIEGRQLKKEQIYINNGLKMINI